MESFFRDKDVWILGSVCLMATFLWRHWRKLLSVRRKGKTSLSADKQVIKFCGGILGPAAPVHLCEQVNLGTPSSALFALTPHTLAGLKANELQACLNRK